MNQFVALEFPLESRECVFPLGLAVRNSEKNKK